MGPGESADRAGAFHVGSVPMGGFGVARDAGTLRTFLGSCIGVGLHDRRLRLAGLAHVVLPCSRGEADEPGKFADTAIPELLRRMRDLAGVETIRPAAKLAGGARMFAFRSAVTVGEENLAAVERVLRDLGIPVLGRACGGTRGRRMALDVVSGVVTVEAVGTAAETL